jgi:hypothetical protein
VTKRDAAIAITSAVVTGAICYALAVTRPDLPARLSRPFSTSSGKAVANGHVVMRVNGQPVTETEFLAIYKQLPEDLQRQFASDQGKMALAEQTVRMKLLEQEAHRLGLESDPGVAGQLAADQANVLANAAAEKMAAQPNDQAIQDFYAKNKDRFGSLDLSHILIAYAGGSVQPRGGRALSPAEARSKAQAVYKQLKAGADFAATARKVSDDVSSAQQGGKIGMIGHGMLPPQLESQVFATPVGEITAPVVSQFGIHIFKVNGHGTQPVEQLRPGIAQRLRQEKLHDRVEALRKGAKVDFDPKYFPAQQPKLPAAGKKPS